MKKEQFSIELQRVAKGSLWKFILSKASPFIWENRAFILLMLKKAEKNHNNAVPAECDKNNPSDPHYGELGDYDKKCDWHPWT